MLHKSNNNVKIIILILNDVKMQRIVLGFGVSLYASAPDEKVLESGTILQTMLYKG